MIYLFSLPISISIKAFQLME